MSVLVIQFLTQHKVNAYAVSNHGVLLFLLFVHIVVFLVVLNFTSSLNFILEICTDFFRT